MKKTSVGKLSILGLVLLSASAVTAAVSHSSQKTSTGKLANGKLVQSADGGVANAHNGLTCKPGVGACHNSVTGVSSANTTAGGGASESNSTTV